MFIQFITARVKDEAAVRDAMDRWRSDVMPNAIGFLGSTSGITKDGELVVVARFESEAEARKNSDREEQGAWWQTIEPHLESPTFVDCDDAEVWGDGGSDDAGFVQIIAGRTKDADRLKQVEQELDGAMDRPDIIGGTSGFNGDRFVDVVYFTSEAEARANEAKPLEGKAKELMDEMQSLAVEMRYYDLTEPVLVTP